MRSAFRKIRSREAGLIGSERIWERGAARSQAGTGPGTNDRHDAISFMLPCETQEEIDYFWGKVSADAHSAREGWLNDKYGPSWQIIPAGFNEMLGDKEKIARLTPMLLNRGSSR